MTKCKYIDSLFEKGLSKAEVLGIIDEEYPKSNNNGTVAARYSIFNKENPDHLVKMTIENAKKDLKRRAKKDPSIDTDYIMLTADQTHEIGGGFPKPDFVSCPDNDDGEIVIEQYYFVGDPKTYKKFPGDRELAQRRKAHIKAWEKKKADDKKAEEKRKEDRRKARVKKQAKKKATKKTAVKKKGRTKKQVIDDFQSRRKTSAKQKSTPKKKPTKKQTTKVADKFFE